MGRMKKKSVAKDNTAWPKPQIGGYEAPKTWFVDETGEQDMAKKRRRTYDFDADKQVAEKEQGRKTRAKLGIKGSAAEHVKIQKMAANIKAGTAGKKKQGKEELTDLWSEDLVAKARPKNDWVAFNGSEKVPARYSRKTKRAPEKTPVPAVVVAHSGASVRPDEKAREELEAIATGKELVRLDDKGVQEEARRAGHPMLRKGIILSGGGGDFDDDDLDEEELDLSHRRVEGNKMTKAQRNKQKRHQEQQKQAEKAKAEKARLRQLNRTGEFNKELTKEEAELEKKHQEMARHQAEMAKQRPRKLGRHTYEEARPEVKLEDEIAPQLRQLEPEGNLFRDRYQSLQKRNVIEAAGGKVKRGRRYKLKVKHYINENGTGLNGLATREPLDTRHTLTPDQKGEMQPGKRKRGGRA